jgi:hypothetical protein
MDRLARARLLALSFPCEQLADGSLPEPRCGLNFFQPWLMESCSTVIIPFDDRVIFVGFFNCAGFSSRLSEVTQTLDAISRIQFPFGGRGWASGGLLARSELGLAPGYDSGGWELYAVWVSDSHCKLLTKIDGSACIPVNVPVFKTGGRRVTLSPVRSTRTRFRHFQ